MDLGTRIFWGVLAVLGGSSLYFGVQTARIREEVRRSGASVATGDLVSLVSVTDGDTIVVKNPAGDDVVVRVLGIKALEGAQAKDSAAVFATVATDSLRRSLEDKPIRVMLGSPPKDRHGRSLATLFVDDHDVGLELVRDGTVLVYTAHPFPSMQEYLDAQAKARSERKGLWADASATKRADLLFGVWRKEAP